MLSIVRAHVDLEALIHRIAIGGEGLRLRDEDRKKVRELGALLPELARELSRPSPLMVDAACGSGWVAIATLALVVPNARAVAIELDPKKAERARTLARAADITTLEVRTADVCEVSAWPEKPDLVVALHACGAATDSIIERAAGAHARSVVVVPCCVASSLPLARAAVERSAQIGLPKSGVVRRRFIEAFVLGARLLRLESLGYSTEAVPFVGETVTPYNIALRGRRHGDRERAARAALDLETLVGSAR
jgi:precorrin-6B methylase 2